MMSIENAERFDILISWLMNYCLEHQIGVIYTKELPSDAQSMSYNYPSDLVVINGNWKPNTEIPFIFAHEIGHNLEGTPVFNRLAYLGEEKGEYSANTFAINLLLLYCFENSILFNSAYDFAKTFGIPKDKWYLIADKY